MLKRRLWVPVLSLFLVGCASFPGAQIQTSDVSLQASRQTESMYPLNKGLYWSYRTTARSGDGPWKPGSDQVSRVVESEHVVGQVRAVVNRKVGDREMAPTRAVSDARAVTLSRLNSPQDGSITIITFPMEPGRSWPGRSWGAHAHETISVVGTESISVPAGTFTTTRFKHRIAYATGLEDTLHYWYAPGVGMVKAIEGLTIDMGGGPVLHQVSAELQDWGNGEVSRLTR